MDNSFTKRYGIINEQNMTQSDLVCHFYSFDDAINMLNSSTINMHKKGERGHPCCNPLDAPKNPKWVPFISKSNEVDDTHPKIQLIVFNPIPV